MLNWLLLVPKPKPTKVKITKHCTISQLFPVHLHYMSSTYLCSSLLLHSACVFLCSLRKVINCFRLSHSTYYA